MIVQRLFAALLLTSAGGLLAQYAPYQPAYPDAAYQQDYAPQGYYIDGQSVPSVDVFYEPLSHYGRWIESRWGRAFQPLVARDWRPYTIGRWEDSPIYGRTWRSDEPFGWATYHYGRWGFDDRYGWVWVPDTVWGPGWVAWRDGGDYAGWAPLPPQVSVSFGLGIASGFDNWNYDHWYEPSWVYVPRAYAYDRSVCSVILPYQRNREFWERTRGVTHYDRDGDHIVNRSFDRGHDSYRGRSLDRDRGQPAWAGGHDREARDLAIRGRDGRGGYDSRAGYDRPAESRQRSAYPAAVEPAYGQPHYWQPFNSQPGYDSRVGNQPAYSRPVAPAVPGDVAAVSNGTAPPPVDPRAAYASRDRFGGGNPNGTGDGPHPNWERRREQAFQPATGGNAPPPFTRGDRGRNDGYTPPPPMQNYSRAPGLDRARAAQVAPPAAAFARPAAPIPPPAPVVQMAPRPAPVPRAEPQRMNRGDNIRPQ